MNETFTAGIIDDLSFLDCYRVDPFGKKMKMKRMKLKEKSSNVDHGMSSDASATSKFPWGLSWYYKNNYAPHRNKAVTLVVVLIMTTTTTFPNSYSRNGIFPLKKFKTTFPTFRPFTIEASCCRGSCSPRVTTRLKAKSWKKNCNWLRMRFALNQMIKRRGGIMHSCWI